MAGNDAGTFALSLFIWFIGFISWIIGFLLLSCLTYFSNDLLSPLLIEFDPCLLDNELLFLTYFWFYKFISLEPDDLSLANYDFSYFRFFLLFYRPKKLILLSWLPLILLFEPDLPRLEQFWFNSFPFPISLLLCAPSSSFLWGL